MEIVCHGKRQKLIHFYNKKTEETFFYGQCNSCLKHHFVKDAQIFYGKKAKEFWEVAEPHAIRSEKLIKSRYYSKFSFDETTYGGEEKNISFSKNTKKFKVTKIYSCQILKYLATDYSTGKIKKLCLIETIRKKRKTA